MHTVLPGLRDVYSAHEQTAMRVSEGPVLEVLVAAQREMDGEIRGGRVLLDTSAGGLTRDAVLGTACERAFVETTVFPAVHTS